MTSHLRSALAIATATLATGCGLITGPACTLEARAALTMDVRDSTTNAPAGHGARIIASTGAFADTVDVPAGSDGAYGLAHEQPGVYTVTVEREGYQTWSREGIRVTEDECHVRTVHVLARLQR